MFFNIDRHCPTRTKMTSTATVTVPPRITAENVATLFPEVDTSLAQEVFPSTVEGSAKDSEELAGYDEEQVRLMDEVCIVLDDDDKPIGSASKKACEYLNLLFLSLGPSQKQYTDQCER